MKNLRQIDLTNTGLTLKGMSHILPAIRAATNTFTFANNKLKFQGAQLLCNRFIENEIR